MQLRMRARSGAIERDGALKQPEPIAASSSPEPPADREIEME
jgi:hypothetical protein